MLRISILALAAAVSAGAASAQVTPAACAQYKQLLMPATQDALKALRGAQTKDDAEETTFLSKVQLEGFSGCTIISDKKKGSSYWDHQFLCRRDMGTSDLATKYVEEVAACVKDVFSERKPEESLLEGKYRVIGYEGEVTSAGKGTHVSFGTTDYAAFKIDKNYAGSEDLSVNVWYHYK